MFLHVSINLPADARCKIGNALVIKICQENTFLTRTFSNRINRRRFLINHDSGLDQKEDKDRDQLQIDMRLSRKVEVWRRISV